MKRLIIALVLVAVLLALPFAFDALHQVFHPKNFGGSYWGTRALFPGAGILFCLSTAFCRKNWVAELVVTAGYILMAMGCFLYYLLPFKIPLLFQRTETTDLLMVACGFLLADLTVQTVRRIKRNNA